MPRPFPKKAPTKQELKIHGARAIKQLPTHSELQSQGYYNWSDTTLGGQPGRLWSMHCYQRPRPNINRPMYPPPDTVITISKALASGLPIAPSSLPEYRERGEPFIMIRYTPRRVRIKVHPDSDFTLETPEGQLIYPGQSTNLDLPKNVDEIIRPKKGTYYEPESKGGPKETSVVVHGALKEALKEYLPSKDSHFSFEVDVSVNKGDIPLAPSGGEPILYDGRPIMIHDQRYTTHKWRLIPTGPAGQVEGLIMSDARRKLHRQQRAAEKDRSFRDKSRN